MPNSVAVALGDRWPQAAGAGPAGRRARVKRDMRHQGFRAMSPPLKVEGAVLFLQFFLWVASWKGESHPVASFPLVFSCFSMISVMDSLSSCRLSSHEAISAVFRAPGGGGLQACHPGPGPPRAPAGLGPAAEGVGLRGPKSCGEGPQLKYVDLSLLLFLFCFLGVDCFLYFFFLFWGGRSCRLSEG